MKRWFSILFLLPPSLLVASDNPKPLPDDLVLSMPGGRSMTFRPVFLGVGEEPFATREFFMGSRTGDEFRQPPTRVRLGGAFLRDREGRQDWLYYMGKYEVTRAQFAAVMGSAPGSGQPDEAPVTGLAPLQIEEFIYKYNLWLRQNQSKNLLERGRAWVRLPTEAEWEFAARGGISVDEVQFDRHTPYPPGDLARNEWFSGAHGGPKPVGRLEANPLGLHDILGNVSELVAGFYQIEYLQGRAGGRIARGGNFRSSADALSSSARNEIPEFLETGETAKQDSLGFRLVLGSPIFVSLGDIRTLKKAWETYEKKRLPAVGSGVSSVTVSDQATFELSEIEKRLNRLRFAKGISDQEKNNASELQSEIALLKSSFTTVEAQIRRAERIAAQAETKFAYIGAGGMLNGYRRLHVHERNGMDTKRVKKEIERSRERYVSAFKSLEELRPETVREAFKLHLTDARSRTHSDHDEVVLQLAQKHFEQFLKTRFLDLDDWENEIQNAAKTISESGEDSSTSHVN